MVCCTYSEMPYFSLFNDVSCILIDQESYSLHLDFINTHFKGLYVIVTEMSLIIKKISFLFQLTIISTLTFALA